MDASVKLAGAPALIKSPLSKHEAHVLPRERITDYRDRLYHGKPEVNYQGIPYRQPKRIERAWASDRLAVMPKQPVSDGLLRDLVVDFIEQMGRRPSRCIYPGDKHKRGRGLIIAGVGFVYLDLVGGGDAVAEAYLE